MNTTKSRGDGAARPRQAAAKREFPKGNGKLRKASKLRRASARRRAVRVYNWNLRAIATCHGRTIECTHDCYADQGRYLWQAARHTANFDVAETFSGIVERTENLPQGAWLRIHTSGDFYSAEYVDRWYLAACLRPDVLFWAYTRAWSELDCRANGLGREDWAALYAALERLRTLPNVQLFASIDSTTTGTVPAGWRVAKLLPEGVTEYEDGLVCPEQTGAMSDCVDCSYCVLAKKGNVGFIKHGPGIAHAA